MRYTFAPLCHRSTHPFVLVAEPCQGCISSFGGSSMIRTLSVLAVGIGVGIAGMNADHHGEKSASVKILAVRDMAEKLDGKEARATAVEVTLVPGQAGAPHRHPGPTFGYVLEGEYEW